MKLRKWNISLPLLFCVFAQTVRSQDSVRHWLLPDHLKVQFAGGIGMVSIGAGYNNKKQWLEGDIYYGYVPQSIGGLTIHSITGKMTISPVKIESKNFQTKPFSIGVLVNYTFGKQYFGFTPANYPFEYYGFPTSLHAGAFIGGQVSKKLRKKNLKQIGLYYEVISFDSELVSYIGNKNSLKISDIITIGTGVKLEF